MISFRNLHFVLYYILILPAVFLLFFFRGEENQLYMNSVDVDDL